MGGNFLAELETVAKELEIGNLDHDKLVERLPAYIRTFAKVP